MSVGRTAFGLSALLFVVSAGIAVAQTDVRVVIIGPSPGDATVARIRQELQILSVAVEFMTPGPNLSDLGVVAKDHGAAAVAVVEGAPRVVRIWAKAAGPAEPELRVDGGGTSEPGLLALRAVELLRARLLPVPVAQVPPIEDGGPAEDASSDAATTVSRFSVPDASPPISLSSPKSSRMPSAFVGPALLATPGGLTPTPQIWLGLRWPVLARADVDGVVLLPTVASTVVRPDGSVNMRVGAVGGGMSVRLTQPTGDVFAGAGFGLAALFGFYAGSAVAPWIGANGSRWMALPYARLGAGYWLSQHIALRGDVLTGVALPEPVIRIAGTRVASFGEPAVVLAAGVELCP